MVTGVDHDLSDNNEQAKHTEVILSLTTELALLYSCTLLCVADDIGDVRFMIDAVHLK